MDTYICLPENLFSIIDTEKLVNVFHQNLDRYFFDNETKVVCKNGIIKPLVVFMNDVKDPSYNKDVSEMVLKLFRKCFKNELMDVDIKINYRKYNDSYNPENEDKQSLENSSGRIPSEFDYDKLSQNYTAIEPRYSFDQVVLSKDIMDSINSAIGIISVEHKVFDEWGLRNIIPETGTALNFYGEPGTGKSMAAEAVAKKLGKRIIKATYADIESKYHGEGPKMVKAIFKAAERDDAVLFLDEADSLLSKRLTNVTDGSSQAINSMRSQLLISLENHRGLVIFASNLVINYDKAFLSRLINIEFVKPTELEREQIWNNHVKSNNISIPLSNDVDLKELAKKYDFCGRDIKNSTKEACIRAALAEKEEVSQDDFIKACDNVLKEKNQLSSAQDHTSTRVNRQDDIKTILQKEIDKKTN